MKTLWETLEIDFKSMKIQDENKEKEFEHQKRSIRTGSGKKTERLIIYNRYRKEQDLEPLTARQYFNDKYFLQDDIDKTLYIIHCTQDYCKSVFDIELEEKEAAKIANIEFQKFYEEGDGILGTIKDQYPLIIHIVKSAHSFTDAKLKHTEETLETLELEIPLEIKLVNYIRDNYAKNQKKKAIKDYLMEIFPQINNKIILDKIATKALQ